MTTMSEDMDVELTPEELKERQQAYGEAAAELGKAIAMGLVPYLGQAVDLYDTICALVDLGGAKTPQEKDDARFDALLAIIGWVPGPGDGVKKSLRIVNKHPERYAPVLFDLLREVLVICNIKTSPEVLLDQLFNEAGIRSNLGEIQASVVDSSLFKKMPEAGQSAVRDSLQWVQNNAGLMVGVVQRRLTTWKRRKPNSSTRGEQHGRRRADEPGQRDGNTGSHGQDRGKEGGATQSVKGQIATASADLLDKAITGIIGEHIADYHCYETFRWGSGWDGHDKGETGIWINAPGRAVPGKLSRHGKLFQLADLANGTGIDSVWRADSHNGGKPYAIVEAKASAAQPRPSRRPATGRRKPGISGKLGVSNLPTAEDLLEPAIEPAGGTGSARPASGRGGGKRGGGKATPGSSTQGSGGSNSGRANGPIVQMSVEWIARNIVSAVGRLDNDIKLRGYSRHIIYTPLTLSSTAQHAQALASGTNDAQSHTNHSTVFHYDESEVKAAINRKKARLRRTHGNMNNLRNEP